MKYLTLQAQEHLRPLTHKDRRILFVPFLGDEAYN
jgi:hypothetical protein